MTSATEEKRVLFELLDKETVTFRLSDLEDPEIRGQFLLLLAVILRLRITERELARLVCDIPEAWGDFVGLRVPRSREEHVSVFQADREPGVNSGNNAVITRIGGPFAH